MEQILPTQKETQICSIMNTTIYCRFSNYQYISFDHQSHYIRLLLIILNTLKSSYSGLNLWQYLRKINVALDISKSSIIILNNLKSCYSGLDLRQYLRTINVALDISKRSQFNSFLSFLIFLKKEPVWTDNSNIFLYHYH